MCISLLKANSQHFDLFTDPLLNISVSVKLPWMIKYNFSNEINLFCAFQDLFIIARWIHQTGLIKQVFIYWLFLFFTIRVLELSKLKADEAKFKQFQDHVESLNKKN